MKLKNSREIPVLLLLLLVGEQGRSQEGDRFVWAQVKYAGAWDPYPGAHGELMRYVTQVTSILVAPQRRAIGLKDPQLFSSPFLFMGGRQPPPALDDEEIRKLRDYLTAGGFLWIDDASGQRSSAFDKWTRQTLKFVFPDSELVPLGSEHVVHRTFFLLKGVAGRVAFAGALEGIDWSGRTAVIYTRNDVLGAMAKDALGKPLYECVPGGELQRMNAEKLALNIVMYSLTGSYKTDAVHQPFLLEKMRLGIQ